MKNDYYKLVGIINYFSVVPSFIMPVYERDGDLYVQQGEHCVGTGVARLELHDIGNVLFFPPCINELEFLLSKFEVIRANKPYTPLFCFQSEDDRIVLGGAEDLLYYFNDYSPESESLKEEIRAFKEDIPNSTTIDIPLARVKTEIHLISGIKTKKVTPGWNEVIVQLHRANGENLSMKVNTIISATYEVDNNDLSPIDKLMNATKEHNVLHMPSTIEKTPKAVITVGVSKAKKSAKVPKVAAAAKASKISKTGKASKSRKTSKTSKTGKGSKTTKTAKTSKVAKPTRVPRAAKATVLK